MQNKSQIEQARDIIRKKPHLIWYSKNYDGFTEKTIFEHVLNYGEWEDVQELVRIYGFKACNEILEEMVTKYKRNNLRKEVISFYPMYFKAHA